MMNVILERDAFQNRQECERKRDEEIDSVSRESGCKCLPDVGLSQCCHATTSCTLPVKVF